MTRKQSISLIFGLVLLSVILLIVRRDQNEEQSSTGSTTSAGSLHLEELNASAVGFQLLSESSSETNRVYVVSRNGQIRTSTVPAFVQFTPEQLEEFSFGTPEDDGPPAPQGRVGLHRHLVFYGIALDGETNGVADAFVDTIIQVSDEQGQRAVTNRITSGADGRFTVEQLWGQLLMITVSKPTNYVTAPPQWFQYGPIGGRPVHVPVPRDPVPFHLHRVQAQEPLVEVNKWWRAPNDGTPVRVDLVTGELVTAGGDLTISIYCPEPYTELKRFPWKLEVRAVQGGLIEVNAESLHYLHSAPGLNYESGFAVEYGPDTPTWSVQHSGMYFLASRNGQHYAKLIFRMNTRWNERGVPFYVQGFVNTNSSRNLQTDVR